MHACARTARRKLISPHSAAARGRAAHIHGRAHGAGLNLNVNTHVQVLTGRIRTYTRRCGPGAGLYWPRYSHKNRSEGSGGERSLSQRTLIMRPRPGERSKITFFPFGSEKSLCTVRTVFLGPNFYEISIASGSRAAPRARRRP